MGRVDLPTEAMSIGLSDLSGAICRIDDSIELEGVDQRLYHQSRFWLFRHMQRNLNQLAPATPEPLRGVVMDVLCGLLSLIRILLVRVRGIRPVLIVEHLRYRGYQWSSGDPYFGLTEAELVDRGEVVVVIGINHGDYLQKLVHGKNLIVLPRQLINAFRYLAGKLSIRNHSVVVSEVMRLVAKVNMNGLVVAKVYHGRLRQICADNWVYDKLIRLVRPKVLLCADAYNSNSSLIFSGNNAGVATVEYQHGIISEGHLGYSFGAKYSPPRNILPQHYLLWGRFWEQCLGNEVKKHSRVRIGTYEYGKWWSRRGRETSSSKGVLFIMQPSAAAFIRERIQDFVAQYPDEEVGVRYHPQQRDRFHELETVRYHSDESIYELFLQYKYVVGCFSTALFEAASMQRKVFYMPDEVFSVYEKTMSDAGIRPLEDFADIYKDDGGIVPGEDIISSLDNVETISDLLKRPSDREGGGI